MLKMRRTDQMEEWILQINYSFIFIGGGGRWCRGYSTGELKEGVHAHHVDIGDRMLLVHFLNSERIKTKLAIIAVVLFLMVKRCGFVLKIVLGVKNQRKTRE